MRKTEVIRHMSETEMIKQMLVLPKDAPIQHYHRHRHLLEEAESYV
jgi:hypothetical protein